jgi:hypothetical protein
LITVDTPPPNSYNLKSSFEGFSPHIKGNTITTSFKLQCSREQNENVFLPGAKTSRMSAAVPGPGAYEIKHKSVGSDGLAIVIKSRTINPAGKFCQQLQTPFTSQNGCQFPVQALTQSTVGSKKANKCFRQVRMPAHNNGLKHLDSKNWKRTRRRDQIPTIKTPFHKVALTYCRSIGLLALKNTTLSKLRTAQEQAPRRLDQAITKRGAILKP